MHFEKEKRESDGPKSHLEQFLEMKMAGEFDGSFSEWEEEFADGPQSGT